MMGDVPCVLHGRRMHGAEARCRPPLRPTCPLPPPRPQAFRTKQDAKHAAAAALLEALLAAESLDPSLVMPREGTAKK